MIKTCLSLFLLVHAIFCFGQSKQEKEIIEEGTKLYKSEMASWYGTDIFLSKFADRRERIGGYFSYLVDDKAVCVFFSNSETPIIIGTFTFDSTYNVNTALIDGQERGLTKQEYDILSIRQAAIEEFQSDTLFKSYNEMNPNFIPVIDNKGKRVYILTGPKNQGIVVFGNDYLLTFDQQNNLTGKKQLHKNIIPIEYGKVGDKQIISTMHSHLPESGDLISATDICTLKLYSKYARWRQHYVISKENVSIWDCQKELLVVMTRKAWDKIADNQKKKSRN
ncbi:MAG: hypothetical protein ABJH04_10030 [Cyclobacteriaceae bacterium]